MMPNAHQKVTANHLKRDAFLYIRQSSLKQVMENQESTKRQYALRERAVALGWPIERVVVIDSDQGQSGAQAADRAGFQKLVAEVGMGNAGIVMGLEVSRLARNSTDWHRLLEICALSQTLILDEDGVYDPSHFNDRLLLGLKGTMSEAELHVLKARLRGGILNKARRGELEMPLPIGLIFREDTKKVVLDPDKQVQETVRLFFETFRRTGAASATVKYFVKKQIKFPKRLHAGPDKGKLFWGGLQHSRALELLHNPRYTGAFVFGRMRTRMRPNGKPEVVPVPRENWHTLIPNAHEGYISWEEFERNLKQLRENAQAIGKDRRRSPPREGPALLQGLVVCGKCGNRMTVRYHSTRGRVFPEYTCMRRSIEHGDPVCQTIHGAAIDDTVGKLLVEIVTPVALEVALAVQQELQSRLDESDRLRKKQIERARYEADLSQRRFMQVDPNNRLVADALEADWNEKLRELTQAKEEYERQTKADHLILDDKKKTEIMKLTTDFPKLWNDPQTPDRERKRMVRLMFEDVTLTKGDDILANIRFKGGATRTLNVAKPKNAWQLRQTPPEVLAEINELLNHHTPNEIVDIMNERGIKPGEGNQFTRSVFNHLKFQYKLKTKRQRLREKGMLTQYEIMKMLKVKKNAIRAWRNAGIIKGHKVSDKREFLYEPPDKGVRKQQGAKLAKRAALIQSIQ
jgi:DNA invertase Pin-like site-specific DNA recombinase